MIIQFTLDILCTDKINDKSKTEFPPPSSTPVAVFLIAENN